MADYIGPHQMRRWFIRGAVCLIILTITFVAGSWLSARHLTSAKPQKVGAPPADFPYPIESAAFKTRDNETIQGWLVPTDSNAPAIVLLHGYRGTRRQMIQRAKLFRSLGYAVLLYDARACGESTGEAITFGLRERADLVAAVDLLRKRGHERIACLGVSQGGATILYAADELGDLRCVVCESVYDDMTNAFDRRSRRLSRSPGWLTGVLVVPFAESRLDVSIDELSPVDHISKVRCPLFVISGDADDRAWPIDTERLFEAAREPKELWMIAGAKHEDLFRFPDYERRVIEFVQRHMVK